MEPVVSTDVGANCSGCGEIVWTMPVDEPHAEGLREALERAGWRCTRQRMAVYDHLVHATTSGFGHPSAEDVYTAVRKVIPSISLATVYKALEALVAAKLVVKLSGDQGTARFDARGENHYHLRCVKTGSVQDLETRFDPDLITKIDPLLTETLQDQGFRVTGYRLEILGYFEGDGTPSSNSG